MSEWININEKRPPYCVEVLVYCLSSAGSEMIGWYELAYLSEHDEFLDTTNCEILKDVTHWQRLTTPTK